MRRLRRMRPPMQAKGDPARGRLGRFLVVGLFSFAELGSLVAGRFNFVELGLLLKRHFVRDNRPHIRHVGKKKKARAIIT